MREVIDLTDKESGALARLASEQGMTFNQVMRQSLRIYEMVRHYSAQGFRLAWIKPDGTEHVEPVGGCMGDDE